MNSYVDSGRLSIAIIFLACLTGLFSLSLFAFVGNGSVMDELAVPYDDAWIHFVFARNLAEYGTLGLNEGVWSGGTSSPLWDLLLAVSYQFDHRLAISAKLLGGLLYVVLYGLLAAIAARWMISRNRSLWWAMIFSITLGGVGMLAYLAFTGMDTLLFLCLGLLALLFFERQFHLGTGIVLAALTVTRVEGLALVVLMWFIVVYLWSRQVRTSRQSVFVFLLPLVAMAGYFSLNWLTTGVGLPTTLIGRKWLFGLDDGLLQLDLTKVQDYIRLWLRYIDEWYFCSSDFDRVPAFGLLYRIVLWGLCGTATVVAIIESIRWLYRPHQSNMGFVLLFAWFLAHNMIYLILLPVPMFRYQSLNLVWVAGSIQIGIMTLVGWLPSHSRWKRPVSVAIVAALMCLVGATYISVVQWRYAWDDHVHHITAVHGQAGHWIDDNLPADAVVAAFDIGAIKYFGKRTVVDLGGLSDTGFMQAVRTEHAPEYLRLHGATHLAMPEPAEGQLSLGNALGVTGPASPYQLIELKTFQTTPFYPIQVPSYGIPSYWYYPAYFHVTVYRIQW